MALPLDQVLREQPVTGLALMFGAGLVTSLTPCVYPMIPIVAGVLGGAATAGRGWKRTALHTAIYILGVALVYASLGLLAGLTGSLFGAVSSNRWAYFAIGNLLLVFGLAMFDVFPLAAPQRLLAWASRFGGGSPGGVFAMGATSGLVAAPCGAPAFAAALTFVTATGSAVWGFLYLFVFSLGMTALLAVVGLVAGAGAALPRSGRWTAWVKRGAGVVLLGMAEYYFIQMGKVS
ncbi:MAG: sulfite exporter TauE/SafE family protein [Gemmatimonadetes bacterium]|nr:sulfite exporter TauE/SafE family protein [Gemmatimonadota bacterium]MBP6668488.1 sulfite exporter TauE/SafE family protein [Gemmatimonadales bacterium]MBK7349110.1 sulfite exporter TauE/SafE family protein [Gemmatimonadota bacterium]MBK7783739.1 sulfite exporter TauE/SafE family protein [Gemmatimonadota bacterium]MBK7924677.1 sulfite exporter TauE/SafE family protein [Gemmatimonadota bacterium]